MNREIKPHHYYPSTMHMGDCSICGNIADDPIHRIEVYGPAFPDINESREQAEPEDIADVSDAMIDAAARAYRKAYVVDCLDISACFRAALEAALSVPQGAPVWWTEAQIDKAAQYLRETLQSGKKLSSWETTPNSTKKKWLALAKGCFRFAEDARL